MRYWGVSKLLAHMDAVEVMQVFDWVESKGQSVLMPNAIVTAANKTVPLLAPTVGFDNDDTGPRMVLVGKPSVVEWLALERVSVMQDTDNVVAITISSLH